MNNPYECLKPYEGKEIKYPELCEIIGEEIKGGRGKVVHLNKIKQYVDIINQNRALYIHKVYDKKDELELIEHNGKFLTYIENFLINMLYKKIKKENINSIVLTNRDILETTLMVNNNYFIGKNKPYLFIEDFNISINNNDLPDRQYLYNKILTESDIFFSSSYRLLKRIVYNSLKSMEKKSLIQVNKTFRLYKNTKDKNGYFHSEYKDCDDKEISRILSVQHSAIKEFNESAPKDSNGKHVYYLSDIKNVRILFPEQKKEFFLILNEMLKNEFKNEGWNTYSTAWKINLAKEDSFDYEVKQLNHNKLNKNVVDKLMSAKDLSIIENALRNQFINKFISIESNVINIDK